MATIVWELTATCPECGGRLRGSRMSFGCRVNLSTIRTGQDLWFTQPCDECGYRDHDQRADDWKMTPDAKSAALIEAAQDKIRARRKVRAA